MILFKSPYISDAVLRILDWFGRKTFEGSYRHVSFSQEAEDILFQILCKKDNGFFVDIGAHHPFRFSNTWLLYKKGWRGINVDANPDSIKVFLRYRPLDISLNQGVSDEKNELTYYSFNESALNTFSPLLRDKYLQTPQYSIVAETRIGVETLASILETNMPINCHIDLLNIDVEGLDLNVLKSNNWQKFRPTHIIIESHFAEAENMMICPVFVFLKDKGYRLVCKLFNSAIYTIDKSE